MDGPESLTNERIEPPPGRSEEIRQQFGGGNRSQPTWVGGGAGHATLGEARMLALEAIADAERKLYEAQVKDNQAQQEVKAALARRKTTSEHLATATATLERAQEALAYRCGIKTAHRAFTDGPPDHAQEEKPDGATVT